MCPLRQCCCQYQVVDNEDYGGSWLINTTHPSDHSLLCSLKYQPLFSFLTGQVSLPCNILFCTQLLYNVPVIISDTFLLVSNGTNSLSLFRWIHAGSRWYDWYDCVVVRRQLPPPLPCAASASDKSVEYVNGMVPEPVRRTSSLDCLNNPSSSSSSSSSSAAAAAASVVADCAATASLTDAGLSLWPGSSNDLWV